MAILPKELLKPELKISRFSPNQWEEIDLPPKHDWIQGILDEFDKDIDTEDTNYRRGNLHSSFRINRKIEKPYDDHLIITGNIKTKFQVPCVRCLSLVQEDIEVDVKACFLPESFEEDPDYEDVMSVFFGADEYDLYFHRKGQANLKELVREQIVVNMMPLPLHDQECSGLCQQCGHDLNKSDCGHNAAPKKIELKD